MCDYMCYPEELLKGIPKDFIDENGLPQARLFHFGEKSGVPMRADDFNEESITWNDDPEAKELLLCQRKGNSQELQFKCGIAILSRKALDGVKVLPLAKDKLDYERAIIPDNKYHGNLLLKKDVPKHVMKYIAASITLCVTQVVNKV